MSTQPWLYHTEKAQAETSLRGWHRGRATLAADRLQYGTRAITALSQPPWSSSPISRLSPPIAHLLPPTRDNAARSALHTAIKPCPVFSPPVAHDPACGDSRREYRNSATSDLATSPHGRGWSGGAASRTPSIAHVQEKGVIFLAAQRSGQLTLLCYSAHMIAEFPL